MWLEAKDDYPTQPKMDGHFMTMYVFTEDWETEWSHRYTYTKSGTVVDSFSFTPESDIDVLVGIYEQNSEGPDPKEYGGVSVNWVRLDMGDRTGEKQITKWTPSSGDVEARNLILDPNFEVSSWETTDGASSRGTEGDVSFMSRYTDDYEDYGFRGVRMTRSGYTGKDGNSDGLIYYIPFRGEGDYTLQAFFKDLNGVTLDDAAFIEVHPADVNQRRICYGFSFGLFRRTDETGYFRVSRAYHFGKTATNAASGVSQEIRWLEVRVFLTWNGDVVVSRMSLAKCGHAVHWNANAVSTELGRTLSTESYVDQRANSLEAGIRKGLQSVGFRMDGETWSVNTWGNLFAWYANEKDAKAGNTGNAVMYMAQDNGTWTLRVKGSVTANLLYGITKEVVFSESMSSYTIDPQKEPATTYFVNNHYNYRSNFFVLPKASDYDGLEISIFCKRTFTDTRMSVDAYKVFVKCANTSDHLYAKKNVANVLRSGASSLNDYQNVATVEDKWINYTDFIGTSVMIQQNSLVKFKSIGGAWYAIEGLFTGE